MEAGGKWEIMAGRARQRAAAQLRAVLRCAPTKHHLRALRCAAPWSCEWTALRLPRARARPEGGLAKNLGGF
eukprot:2726979-Alexandrium_andersonii.AAC.1